MSWHTVHLVTFLWSFLQNPQIFYFLGSGATIEHNKSSRTWHFPALSYWLTNTLNYVFIQSVITLSLKIMSCPAVSCSKCVSGDVNWPCENMCKQPSYADKKELSQSHWIIFILSLFLFWNIRGVLPTVKSNTVFSPSPSHYYTSTQGTDAIIAWLEFFFSILLVILQSPDTKTQTDTPSLFCWLQHYFSQTWEETIYHHQLTRCMATQKYTT